MDQNSNLHERIIASFSEVKDADFFPDNITEVLDLINKPETFDEFASIISRTNDRLINHTCDTSIYEFANEYKEKVDELKKLRNVFSYDTNFI